MPSLAYDGNNHFCDSNAEHCYLNLPDDMVDNNPLDLEHIKEKQDEDNDLHQTLTKHPTWSSHKYIDDVNDILCYYIKPGDNAANGKIVLPKDLIVPTIRWYHQVAGHPEKKRIYQHIHQQYYNCDLCRQCCIHDLGTELTGPEFQILLQFFYIRAVHTTAKNP